MAYLLFFRFENEVLVGVEVIHSSEASERLMACYNTHIRLEELGPLNQWMDEPAQKSFSNSAKKNVSREEVAGLIENNRNKKPSILISQLEEYLERTAPATEAPPRTAREILISRNTIAAVHRVRAHQAAVQQAAMGGSTEQRSWFQRWFHGFQ